jgi:hypothetical protein
MVVAGKQKWTSPSSASIGVEDKRFSCRPYLSQPLAADTCNGRAASVPANDVSRASPKARLWAKSLKSLNLDFGTMATRFEFVV